MEEIFPGMGKGVTLTSSTKIKQSLLGGSCVRHSSRTLGLCSSMKQRSGVSCA